MRVSPSKTIPSGSHFASVCSPATGRRSPDARRAGRSRGAATRRELEPSNSSNTPGAAAGHLHPGPSLLKASLFTSDFTHKSPLHSVYGYVARPTMTETCWFAADRHRRQRATGVQASMAVDGGRVTVDRWWPAVAREADRWSMPAGWPSRPGSSTCTRTPTSRCPPIRRDELAQSGRHDRGHRQLRLLAGAPVADPERADELRERGGLGRTSTGRGGRSGHT